MCRAKRSSPSSLKHRRGKLGKAARSLAAFAKTETLQPGESETLTLTFPIANLASYDDSGVTGHRFCYVLESGAYNVYTGGCVRGAKALRQL